MSETSGDRRADREAAIVDAFVHLADTLVADYDVIDLLYFLIERCVEFTDVDEAGVMIASPTGHLQAVASSTERSHLLDLFELQNRDGPCLDAFRQAVTITSEDLSNDLVRWPTFAPRAVEVGFAAVHSVPLLLRDNVVGALNLLMVSTGVLADADAKLVRALADIATIGILQQRTISQTSTRNEGLQTALISRIRIEQAKGIMAERTGVGLDEAFELIRAYARRHQMKLTDVCTGVVNRTLTIPTGPAA